MMLYCSVVWNVAAAMLRCAVTHSGSVVTLNGVVVTTWSGVVVTWSWVHHMEVQGC